MSSTSGKMNSAGSDDAGVEEPQRLPTALVYDQAFLDHLVPEGFPELPGRLQGAISMIEALLAEGTLPREAVLRLDPRAATDQDLVAVHSEEHVERLREAVRNLAESGETHRKTRKFASEVYISAGSYT